jgi:hypothetical protein
MERVVAVYSIVVGILVFAMWAVSLARHQVPELATKPWEIRTHISAEWIMAATMLGGGATSLAGVGAGRPVLLLGLGMTIYSIVNASGYYLERRQAPPVVMFGVLLILTALAAGTLIV